MKPLYIFDLDGTLALTEHRQHILDSDSPTKWRDFFAKCVDDQPNEPVIRTLQALRRSGAECWIWSGRSDEVKPQTVEWLCTHGCFGNAITNYLPAWPFGAPERLRMRAAGDFTPDEQLKFGWLADLEPPERNRLTAVFDDRDKVVAMWRANGVPCFQVAPGAF